MTEIDIKYEVRKLDLDLEDAGQIVAEMEEDPRNGFNLQLGGGRTTIRFTLSEARRLGYFIATLLPSANKKILEVDKNLAACQPPLTVDPEAKSMIIKKGDILQSEKPEAE